MDGNVNVKKTKKRFDKQNNNFARASHFFVHSFLLFSRPRRENAKFRVLCNDEILFLVLSLEMVLWNSASFDKVSG